MPLTLLYRQKRRLGLLALGTFLGLWAAPLGGLWLALFATPIVLAGGVSTVLRAPEYRQAVEVGGIAFLLGGAIAYAIPLGFLAWPAALFIGAGLGYFALYGPWGAVRDLWIPHSSHETRQINQTPEAVWSAVIPGEGHPDDGWGAVQDFDRDPDDDETVYVAHGDGTEETICFVTRSRPRLARYLRARDGEDEALMEITLTEITEGVTHLTATLAFDALRPARAVLHFFDDTLADEIDSVAAWLEGHEDTSLHWALKVNSVPTGTETAGERLFETPDPAAEAETFDPASVPGE